MISLSLVSLQQMRRKLEAGDITSKDIEQVCIHLFFNCNYMPTCLACSHCAYFIQNDEVKEVRKSLLPPPQSTVTWDDYICGYESADERCSVFCIVWCKPFYLSHFYTLWIS